MNRSLIRLLLTCACALVAQPSAFAQGGASSQRQLPAERDRGRQPARRGANIFTTASAYQDLNNQFDPGGRLGQVMFRLNW